jgi:DeoR/GlpR family transcriptional regulator of sugar metabolism
MNRVFVSHGEKKELMKIFGVSHVTVREALNGNLGSKLAAKIRKAAVERGGVEQTQKPIQ